MGSPAGIVWDLNISPVNCSYRLCMSSPEALHPNLDWSLRDLKEELDALQINLNKSPVLPNANSPLKQSTSSYSFSWKELSVTADFGRTGCPFRISAFDSDSDGDEDIQVQESLELKETLVESKESEGGSISRKGNANLNGKGSWLLPKTEISEGLMFELERGRLQRVQEEVRQRRLVLEAAIEEESIRSAAIFDQVEREEESKHELARRIDKQYQRSIAEVRDTHLSALQREHEQRSQVEERKLRREADAKKREALAREERERQEKLRAEVEAKRIEDAKLAVEAERIRKAEAAEAAALQRAEAEKLAKESKERAFQKNKASGPKAKVSESGATVENIRRMKLNALVEMSQPLRMDPNLKKPLKDHERNLTKLLQQVSATQEQVRIKSMNLINELISSPYQAFSLTTFASKLMSQCEIQVSKLPSFAFALAQVVVNISSRIPDVMDIVIAKLNQVCIYTVPKYYTFTKSQFENDRDYYKLLGYIENEAGIENTDDYVSRMNAYVTLYAAIIQAEIEGNSHGLKEGWTWCARFLNSLPADRLTASALEAFLKVAGFRLYMVYQKAFVKLLNVIVVDFIGSLKQQKDPDSRAVLSRLETYIGTRQFMKEPDGRSMPKSDLSSALKC